MMTQRAYFDTSVLVKRYIQERSGARLQFITADARQSEGAQRMALRVTSLASLEDRGS
jgi:hypothetical protein